MREIILFTLAGAIVELAMRLHRHREENTIKRLLREWRR